MTWPTLQSPQSELEVPAPENDVLEKVYLFGCAEWDPQNQWEMQSILREYADVFAKDNLYLRQTSIVKHEITLETGARAIKEHYRRVPLGLNDEIHGHLQEMIDIWAKWPSYTPWASVVVLVRENNGKLHFCINIRKLNSMMIKDTYSIPGI